MPVKLPLLFSRRSSGKLKFMWGILKRVLATSLLVGLLAANPLPVLSAAASSPGKVCPKAGQTALSGGKLFTCIKSGSKLVWNAGKPVARKFVETPTPRISGAAVIGETLSAKPGSWDSGVLLSYQWLSGGRVIDGANDRTYVPSENDLGRKISLRVTGTKKGFSSVSRVSAQTANVKSPSVTPPASQTQKVFKTSSVPIITGSPKVGGELIAEVGQWDSGVTFSYQWIKNNVAIPGANRFSYVPTEDDLGTFVTVAVTGTKIGFRNATQVSGVAFITASLNSFPSVSLPQVQGSAVVGSTLNAVFSDWGVSGIQYGYQWTRNGSNIPSANSKSYRLTNADLTAFVAVLVSGSRSGYFTETRTSNEVGPVQNVSAPPLLIFANASDPSTTGSLTPGSTLTATHAAWDTGVAYSFQWYQNGLAIAEATLSKYEIRAADVGKTISVALTGSKSGYASQSRTREAGVATAATFANIPTPTIEGLALEGSTLTLGAGSFNWSSPAQTSIQWLKNGVGVAGATGNSLVLSAADIGAVFTVAVTGSARGYTSTTKVSAPTSVVTAAALVGSKPTISGTAQVGQTLTANPGYWESGVSLAYQWMRNGTSITGASSATYTLVPEDNATKVYVEVIGTKTGMPNLAQASNAVSVTTTILTLTPTPTISGTPQVGQTLTANAGTWDAGTGITYRWKRGASIISGATTSTYTLVSADLNATISVDVTGAITGNLPVTKSSAGVGPVVAAAILVQGTPTIAGTAQVGTTLTGAIGTWESGWSFTQQWRRNGAAISGATSLNYTLVAADQGATITLAVTGISGSASATKTSSPTSAVALGVFSSSPNGFLTSTYKVGTSVTGGVTAWSPGPTYTYQWLRNGVAVSGATGTTYQLTSADLGAFMSFAITGTLAGYTTKTSTVNSGTAVMEGAISPAPTPTIVGSNRVGQVLTASPGTWMSGATLTYQWLRGGTAISGATSASYTVLESDAGANISVAVRGSATAYASATMTSVAVKIVTPPKLPSITSTFAKTTRFDVYWTWEANTTYGFTAKNASGTVVGQYSCSTTCVSPFWIESLPANSAAVNYTLEYFATTDSGTVTGSTTASTYPTLAITLTYNSITKTGDKWVFDFQTVPGWTYFYNDYNPSNSKCGLRSPDTGASPITIWRANPGFPTCSQAINVRDNRGNTARVVMPSNLLTHSAIPTPALTGSLSATSTSSASPVAFSVTFFSYCSYVSFTIVIRNSLGAVVTPAIAPTVTKTGDNWNGTISGNVYFTGLPSGTYTVRGDFRNDWTNSSQHPSIDLGTVSVTG